MPKKKKEDWFLLLDFVHCLQQHKANSRTVKTEKRHQFIVVHLTDIKKKRTVNQIWNCSEALGLTSHFQFIPIFLKEKKVFILSYIENCRNQYGVGFFLISLDRKNWSSISQSQKKKIMLLISSYEWRWK